MACTWKYDCTSGTCEQVPICQNSLDMPGIKPLGIAPIAPIAGPKPLAIPSIPPIGTRSCSQRYIYGRGWTEICQ